MTSLTLSGERGCRLEAEDERLRVSWMNVFRNCDDRDRSRRRLGLFGGSIGVGGVAVFVGACLGAMSQT